MKRRPRRLRRDGIREFVAETTVDRDDLIAPVFVDATIDVADPIESMPGYERQPVADVGAYIERLRSDGVAAVILFGIPGAKDEQGSLAWADDGVIQQALTAVDDQVDDALTVITDVCLCEYTSHGHCGVLEPEGDKSGLTVDNDASIELLARTAVSHADAGADMVAPSASLDGMVGAIRQSLDGAGHQTVSTMSYSAKYHSAFYGPFRDAADGAPAFGDRRHYQMDPANRREAMREVHLDIEEGADILMVKPALPYLDVISDVADAVDLPVAAYHVSGEYAMLMAANERGWLDAEATALESLTSIKRSGADLIISYTTPMLIEQL